MMQEMQKFEDWLCLTRKAKRLALIAHVSPDGDTLGATLALRLAFLSLGKAVDVICDGEVPNSMRFLPGSDSVIRPENAQGTYDTAMAVDVSAPDMLGASRNIFEAADTRLVIDHHATNDGYGDANFIRRGESACCVLALEAIEALGVCVTVDMATCLFTGMSTDSGHFMYPSTSAATFYAAAKLREIGVDISDLTRKLYRTQPMEKVMLTRIAYQKLHFELDGRVGVIELSKQNLEDAGCLSGQSDGLVNRALEVEGVRMAVLATERQDGIKLSMRAVEPDTVNDIAVMFGGGGHAQAAGCTIHATLHEATQMVLDEMAKKLGQKA